MSCLSAVLSVLGYIHLASMPSQTLSLTYTSVNDGGVMESASHYGVVMPHFAIKCFQTLYGPYAIMIPQLLYIFIL